MSAPPLDAPPTMPTMVSRLPKFGSRPKSDTFPNGAQIGPAAAATRLTNGFYHHPGPAGVNGALTAPPASLKQNGFLRVPSSFPAKWRKENEAAEDGRNRAVKNRFYSHVTSWSDAKKQTTTAAGKGRGFGHHVTSGIRTPPASRGGPKPGQGGFGLTNGARLTQNGFSGPKPRSWSHNSALRQPQSFTHSGALRPGSGPASRSGSPLQKKQPANRSHSSDSIESTPPVPLTESDRLRSRSLTQVRRQPSPGLTPTSPGLTPSSTSSCSSVSQSSVKSPTSDGVGRGGGAKNQPARSGVSAPSLLPPSALKKPLLLSHGPASKSSGISYKLSRPSLTKQTRPLRVSTANENAADQELNQSPSTEENSPGTKLTQHFITFITKKTNF